VEAPPSAVFEYLSDLENHWQLADRFIEVLRLERGPDGRAHGGSVRMHGPLGLRRTATTRVVEAVPESIMRGTADLGGTRALVRWSLSAQSESTVVDLVAEVEQAGWRDRALLAVGGRRWLARRFRAILERLAALLDGKASGPAN
jgi:hypothetical protein